MNHELRNRVIQHPKTMVQAVSCCSFSRSLYALALMFPPKLTHLLRELDRTACSAVLATSRCCMRARRLAFASTLATCRQKAGSASSSPGPKLVGNRCVLPAGVIRG